MLIIEISYEIYINSHKNDGFKKIFIAAMKNSNPTYGFESRTKQKKTLISERLHIYCLSLAGDESLNWHPFLTDFVTVAQKLEQLGFTYFKVELLLSSLHDGALASMAIVGA